MTKIVSFLGLLVVVGICISPATCQKTAADFSAYLTAHNCTNKLDGTTVTLDTTFDATTPCHFAGQGSDFFLENKNATGPACSFSFASGSIVGNQNTCTYSFVIRNGLISAINTWDLTSCTFTSILNCTTFLTRDEVLYLSAQAGEITVEPCNRFGGDNYTLFKVTDNGNTVTDMEVTRGATFTESDFNDFYYYCKTSKGRIEVHYIEQPTFDAEQVNSTEVLSPITEGSFREIKVTCTVALSSGQMSDSEPKSWYFLWYNTTGNSSVLLAAEPVPNLYTIEKTKSRGGEEANKWDSTLMTYMRDSNAVTGLSFMCVLKNNVTLPSELTVRRASYSLSSVRSQTSLFVLGPIALSVFLLVLFVALAFFLEKRQAHEIDENNNAKSGRK